MSQPEYKKKIAEGATVFLPIGAVENHGPHLPLGVDLFLAEAVAKGVSKKCHGIVSPSVPYGYKSQPQTGGGCHFVGTTCVDSESLTLYAKNIIKSFAEDGVKNFVILNGHLENRPSIVEAIDKVVEGKAFPELQVIRTDYWDFSSKKILAQVFPPDFESFDCEHGGILETSLMLYLFPELVRMDLAPVDIDFKTMPYDIYPNSSRYIPSHGVLSSPKTASKEKGEILYNEYVLGIAKVLEDEFGSFRDFSERKEGAQTYQVL